MITAYHLLDLNNACITNNTVIGIGNELTCVSSDVKIVSYINSILVITNNYEGHEKILVVPGKVDTELPQIQICQMCLNIKLRNETIVVKSCELCSFNRIRSN